MQQILKVKEFLQMGGRKIAKKQKKSSPQTTTGCSASAIKGKGCSMDQERPPMHVLPCVCDTTRKTHSWAHHRQWCAFSIPYVKTKINWRFLLIYG